ncbi:signal peptidase II [Micrococcus porci]|uniref:signal peptidase II n=1 Tax=Micrococcus porci TaxID=2856555 RepID=UPI003CF97179
MSPAAPQDAVTDRRDAPARQGRGLIGAALGVATLAYALDQGTKLLVERTMDLGESIVVIPGLLRWHYILNPGAAFSIGTDVTWLFTLIQAVVAVVALVALLRSRSRAWSVALGGLLGGVMGNLTDRLFRPPSFGQGHVVDMVSVPNFAIFNVADSFIVCSILTLCLLLMSGRRLDGTRESDAAAEA